MALSYVGRSDYMLTAEISSYWISQLSSGNLCQILLMLLYCHRAIQRQELWNNGLAGRSFVTVYDDRNRLTTLSVQEYTLASDHASLGAPTVEYLRGSDYGGGIGGGCSTPCVQAFRATTATTAVVM